jgi:hypothetical protein
VRPPLLRVLPCLLIAGLALSEASARGDTLDRCLSAHTEAQRQRKDGKLRASHDQLLICGREACPRVVRAECGAWIVEVEALMPSVVLALRAPDGRDIRNARVTIDGALALTALDGRELQLDPGPHTIKIEVPGFETIERDVILAEREKARSLTFSASSVASASTPSQAPSAPAASVAVVPEPARRSFSTAPFVALGIGVAALGVFGTFGLMGRAEYFDVRDRCSPRCTSDDVASVRTDWLVADVALAASVVALGVATYLFLARGTTPAPAHGSRR